MKYHPNAPLPAAPLFYVVDRRSLEAVRQVMHRLFEECRMDGDAMRDAAQSLELVMGNAEPFEEFAPLEPCTPARGPHEAVGLAARPIVDTTTIGREARDVSAKAFRIADADINPDAYLER